jgi:protocatechuate 3,4-dioxygenase beta subunit
MSIRNRILAPPDLPLRTFEGRPLANRDEPVFDQGLAFDLETVMARRQLLKLVGFAAAGSGLLGLAACLPGTNAASSGAASTSGASGSAATADCTTIPEETAGPYPGDGSNGPDVLNQSGVVRNDIRSSFGSASGVAAGVSLLINLTIQDQSKACAPLAGAAVYAWHCDREGRYSLYSQGVTGENYLRGVLATDANGLASFQSIFPACYSGRWPHIHFEVYPSLEQAASASGKLATSQIALPKDICDQVYATDGYSQSIQNLSQVSLQSDMVFGDDGGAHQLGTITGSIDSGLVVALAVPVSA